MTVDASAESALRDRSLRGGSFAGARLVGADLRGVDLRGADLRGADFSGVRTGMRPSGKAPLVAASLVLSLGVGAVAGLAGGVLARLILGLGRARAGRGWHRRQVGFRPGVVTWFACALGTRFEDADLRNAIFDRALLEASDFRGARLGGARFENAQIRLCRFDDARMRTRGTHPATRGQPAPHGTT